MTPPRTAVHKCNKEEEINNLTLQVTRLVTMVEPMVADVKVATEFIIQSRERERLANEGDSKKSRDANTWVNIIIAVVALGALAVSIMAFRAG